MKIAEGARSQLPPEARDREQAAWYMAQQLQTCLDALKTSQAEVTAGWWCLYNHHTRFKFILP